MNASLSHSFAEANAKVIDEVAEVNAKVIDEVAEANAKESITQHTSGLKSEFSSEVFVICKSV